jgi:hypothetical protein
MLLVKRNNQPHQNKQGRDDQFDRPAMLFLSHNLFQGR